MALPAPLLAARAPLPVVADFTGLAFSSVASAIVFLLLIAPQKRFPKRQELLGADGGTNAGHQTMVKIQVVIGRQARRQDLFGLEQMAHIGARMPPTD